MKAREPSNFNFNFIGFFQLHGALGIGVLLEFLMRFTLLFPPSKVSKGGSAATYTFYSTRKWTQDSQSEWRIMKEMMQV